MKLTLIILSSLTFAYKAKDLLSAQNIKTHIIKTPSKYGITSCSYSLEIKGNPDKAIDIIKTKGIKIIKIASC